MRRRTRGTPPSCSRVGGSIALRQPALYGPDAQRMVCGRAVVGPEERLLAARALALRRDRDALVVQIRHSARAIIRGHDLEPARSAEREDRRAVAARIIAIRPEQSLLAIE